MIDWARVSELRQEVGEEEFQEVLEIFLAEVEETLETLTTDLDQGEFHSILHFLKGCALNLGFSTFASICRTGEAASSDGCFDPTEIKMIRSHYDNSKSAFFEKVGLDNAA